MDQAIKRHNSASNGPRLAACRCSVPITPIYTRHRRSALPSPHRNTATVAQFVQHVDWGHASRCRSSGEAMAGIIIVAAARIYVCTTCTWVRHYTLHVMAPAPHLASVVSSSSSSPRGMRAFSTGHRNTRPWHSSGVVPVAHGKKELQL
jgi:hypothetical protein